MQNVTSVNNSVKQYPVVQFKATNNPYAGIPANYQQDMFEKQQKQEKRQKWSTIGSVTLAAAFGIMALVALMKLKPEMDMIKASKKAAKEQAKYYEKAAKNINEADKTAELMHIYENIGNAKSINDLVLPDSLIETTKEVLNQIKLAQEVLERGGEGSKSLLLYGPPGTGKTTFAKAIAKELKAKFASIDMTKLSSKYIGETEKNLNAMIDKICADADAALAKYNSELSKVIGEDIVKEGNKKKIAQAIEKAKKEGKKIPEMERTVVFCDEIDSVIMVDTGSSAKYSNDILNEFKKMFTEKLGKRENIVVIGATNLEIDATKAALEGKSLDKPMLDRFASKIRVPNPDKRQIKNSIIKHYQGATLVDTDLTDASKIDKLAKFMAEEKHNISFRTLENIFNKTANRTAGLEEKVSLSDIKQTFMEMQEELNMRPDEIDNAFKAIIK